MDPGRRFYQQSVWMIGTTLLGGGLLYLVHIPIAAHLPPGQYSIFATLLQVIHLLMIPTLALQIIFTEESASSSSELERGTLASIVRTVLAWFFGAWLLFSAATFLLREPLSRLMGVAHPLAFWVTMLTGWSLLWLPIMQGIMQGRENFKWLGWLAVINGVGRYLAVLVAFFCEGEIVAVMWAVWFGMMINLVVGMSQTTDIWRAPKIRIRWKEWFKKVAPMTLGLGCSQIMFSADMVLVQSLLKDEPDMDLYGFAGTIARGLVILTTPLVGVMFPKIVDASKAGRSSTTLRDALIAAAFLSIAAASVCSLFPEIIVKVLNKPRYLPAANLIPFFCAAMIPLVLANVLLGYVMARRNFRSIPWIVLSTALYLFWFVMMKDLYLGIDLMSTFRRAILTVGCFNLLFLVLICWSVRTNRTLKHPAPI